MAASFIYSLVEWHGVKEVGAMVDVLGLYSDTLTQLASNTSIKKADKVIKGWSSDESRHVAVLAGNMVKAAVALHSDGDSSAAFGWAVEAHNALVNVMRETTRWILPVVYLMTKQLRVLAETADREAAGDGATANESHLGRAAEPLRKTFKVVFNDRKPPSESRKIGMLFLVNQLMFTYFKRKSILNCKQLINSMESGKALPIDSFPVSQQVTYYYFVGRYHLFDGNDAEAARVLGLAFSMCDPDAHVNRAHILVFLVPVRLLLGLAPSQTLLEAYGLDPYVDLVAAVSAGDIAAFKAALLAHRSFFIAKGVYLMLERLRIIVYRNLFRKVWLIQGSTRVPFAYFHRALTFLGEPVDTAETECLLANLIHKGYMKGYLSHARSILVLGKDSPFPPVASITNK